MENIGLGEWRSNGGFAKEIFGISRSAKGISVWLRCDKISSSLECLYTLLSFCIF